MRLSDRLSKEQVNKLNRLRDTRLTKKEWLELMGVNRDTYKKVNGKWRRR